MDKLPDYLIEHHKNDIIKIIQHGEIDKHFSININFMQLFEENTVLGSKILTDFELTLSKCSSYLQNVQKTIFEELSYGNIKENVHLRVFSLPSCSELNRNVFPSNKDLELFLQVTGTVIKSGIPKILEYKRSYKCVKCKNVVEMEADFYQKYLLEPPRRCLNPDCKANKFVVDNELSVCTSKDYQEVKIQEQTLHSETGCIPNCLRVILEDDLVDSCKPGDLITVCGVVKRQFSPLIVNQKIHVEVVILADHIQVNNDSSLIVVTPETRQYFTSFWEHYHKNPLKGRDIIVKSFCPHIYGLHLVKLGVLITLAGGSTFQKKNDSNVRTRSEPHILLVGDPGTAKSQFLRAASKIITRSILTTGAGSTSAGLTVTALKENNEWQLEAGALVLSDGGVCCIDEFNSMKETDKTSIHEAMEQQSISVAKAGIVCKLNTRCSILAATNPKRTWDSNHPITINIGLPSPLLSRFDLVFILRDINDKKWDKVVAQYILNDNSNTPILKENVNDSNEENLWDLEMLQAYFVTIRKINPVLNENSNKILAAYYQFQRKALTRNRARTTVRLLDSLIRLAQAHAKLMFRDEVEVLDAIMVVILIETSMEKESSVLNLNLDIRSPSADNPEGNYLEIAQKVLEKLQLFDILRDELADFKNKTLNVSDLKSFRETGKLYKKINKAFCNRKESFTIVYKRNESKHLNANESSSFDISFSPEKNQSREVFSRNEGNKPKQFQFDSDFLNNLNESLFNIEDNEPKAGSSKENVDSFKILKNKDSAMNIEGDFNSKINQFKAGRSKENVDSHKTLKSKNIQEHKKLSPFDLSDLDQSTFNLSCNQNTNDSLILNESLINNEDDFRSKINKSRGNVENSSKTLKNKDDEERKKRSPFDLSDLDQSTFNLSSDQNVNDSLLFNLDEGVVESLNKASSIKGSKNVLKPLKSTQKSIFDTTINDSDLDI